MIDRVADFVMFKALPVLATAGIYVILFGVH